MRANTASVTTNGNSIVATRVKRSQGQPDKHVLSKTETAILALLALCVLAAAVLPALSAADAAWPAAVTIKVGEAQTLWEIAKAHPIEGLSTAQTVAAIRERNGLTESGLLAGQLLKVPREPSSGGGLASR
ncbi:MAG: LysM peptidoglycan-binding domain-containing protein [Actinomycetia bacterium]|nr:LysM peptidoglycan-binding domain-containing protein [Actinomycetes bacterium]